MRSSQQETMAYTKPRQTQHTVKPQQETVDTQSFLPPQRYPLAQTISRISNTPSASTHAAMLNRSPAVGQPYNRQVVLQLQRQYGNRYVNQVVQMARRGEAEAVGEGGGASGVHQENKTGLPDNLKAGIETLSGMSMDDVKVYYNSDKPAQLQALAYTQGTDIYMGSGQEKHLPHEVWHVVQQKQERVKPTIHTKGVHINDDHALETEADVMGREAMTTGEEKVDSVEAKTNPISILPNPIQRRVSQWNIVNCPEGTIVYHTTSQEGALSISTDGIRQVPNAWGGGILGAGFYTHTSRLGAEVYGQQRYTIEFRVTTNLTGQVVPRGVIGQGINNQIYLPGHSYLEDNDFLTNEDDRNEYKFHNGNNLEILRIYDNVENRTYNSTNDFIAAIVI